MNNKRILYLDIINVVSCFSVVALHCDSYIHQYNHAETYWWLRALVNVLFYNAVPLFFMLSGATLIGYHKRYDTKTFFKKRIKRTVVPFLFWSICFSLLYVITRYGKDNGMDILKVIVGGFITGNVPFTTYWFFIPLFLLYAFMPFLSVMVGHLSDKQQLYLIGLLFFLQSCIAPLIQSTNNLSWTWVPIHSLPICGYVLYALLGYYLSHNSVEKDDRILCGTIVLSLILLAVRYVFVFNATSHSPNIFNYMAAYAVVPSVAIFLIVKRLSLRLRGGYSFACYQNVASEFSLYKCLR